MIFDISDEERKIFENEMLKHGYTDHSRDWCGEYISINMSCALIGWMIYLEYMRGK